MRPIRFRVWDKRNRKMYNWCDIYNVYRNYTNEIGVEVRLEDDSQMRLSKFELMQFTGLKDKNGKEIYEGDIIESRYESIGAGEIISQNPVEWNAPCFYLGGKQMQYNPNGVIAKAWQKDQTIIGNIYEQEADHETPQA